MTPTPSNLHFLGAPHCSVMVLSNWQRHDIASAETPRGLTGRPDGENRAVAGESAHLSAGRGRGAATDICVAVQRLPPVVLLRAQGGRAQNPVPRASSNSNPWELRILLAEEATKLHMAEINVKTH